MTAYIPADRLHAARDIQLADMVARLAEPWAPFPRGRLRRLAANASTSSSVKPIDDALATSTWISAYQRARLASPKQQLDACRAALAILLAPHAPTRSALATALGIEPPALARWLKRLGISHRIDAAQQAPDAASQLAEATLVEMLRPEAPQWRTFRAA